jgi:hypothetical protein
MSYRMSFPLIVSLAVWPGVSPWAEVDSKHNHDAKHHEGHHEDEDHHEDRHESHHADHHEAVNTDEPGVHVHGDARLTLVQTGQELVLQLESPAFNLVGFEHKPSTAEHHRQIQRVKAILTEVSAIVQLPARAHCHQQSHSVQSALWPDEHTANESDHADITAQYQLICKKPDQLQVLDVSLFKQFPAVHTLQVEWALDSGQGAARVDPSQTKLSLRHAD